MNSFKFDWSSSYETGIPEIDDQHKQLFSIGRNMEQMAIKGGDNVTDKEILDLVMSLRDFTGFHFYSEEKLMDDIRYENSPQHKKHHAQMLYFVSNYDIKKFRKNFDATVQEIMDIIKDQILHHILGEDMEFAKAYKTYQKMHKTLDDKIKADRLENEDLYGYLIREFDCSIAYLMRDQRQTGHCVVVNKEKHARYLSMTALERDSFHADMIKVAKAVKKVFEPDAIDYMYLEDIDDHLLYHIIPKYNGNEYYGKVPSWNRDGNLEEEMYEDMISRIRAEIK